MRLEETVDEVVHTVHLRTVICDVCKTEYTPGSSSIWTDHLYDHLETDVSITEGTIVPDGAEYTTTSFDVCPTCFKDVLIPFLIERGATPTITNHSW